MLQQSVIDLSRRKCPARLACLIMLLCLAPGCSDRLATYPVAGRVQFKTGGAVHTGTVELKSRDHGIHARGPIQNDGSFSLSTYVEGDGAVAGLHDCVVVQLVLAEGIAGHKPSNIGVIDQKHASYATSGLRIEVSPDGANQVLLEVNGILNKQPQDHAH